MMQVSQELGRGNIRLTFLSSDLEIFIVHTEMTPDAAIELAKRLVIEANELKEELAG